MTGSLSFAGLGAKVHAGMASKLVGLCVALFLVGFGLKAAMMPFHGWAPDVYPSAPAPVSAMLAGLLGKTAGLYALARLAYDVFGMPVQLSNALLALGTLSMVAGALLALGQVDFKRMLAYSSISQIGYVVVGLAIGTPLGVLGGLFHLFNHGVFKSLLFLNAGSTEYSAGTRDMDKLGGISNRMPITGLTTSIGMFSIAGIPPFNGFWSKLIIIIALVQAQMYGIAVIAIGTSILTLWYFLWMQRRVFFGKLAEGLEKLKEVPFSMTFATFSLALLCLVIGVGFYWVAQYLIEPGVVALLGQGTGLF